MYILAPAAVAVRGLHVTGDADRAWPGVGRGCPRSHVEAVAVLQRTAPLRRQQAPWSGPLGSAAGAEAGTLMHATRGAQGQVLRVRGPATVALHRLVPKSQKIDPKLTFLLVTSDVLIANFLTVKR